MILIPRIFHAVWLGPRPAPEELFRSWCNLNPDWEFRLHTNKKGWRNQAAMDFLLENQPLGAHLAYSACSDIMRFELLAEYGGFYIDADTEAVRALPDFASESVACWENETQQPGWVASCVLGARPGSSLFKEIVEEIPKLDMRKHPAHELGPGIVTRFSKRHPELDVLPSRAFCPHYYTGARALQTNTPTYSVHYWGGTHALRRDKDGRWLDHDPITQPEELIETPGRKPLVSVIIPCMGQAKFLAEAVASVRAQSFQDLEIIVACGDSDSIVAAKKLASTENYSILMGLDKGLGHARNEAIKTARGQFILPLDADDILAPSFISRMLPHLDQEYAIAGCRVQEFGIRQGTWNLSPWEGLLEQNAIPACSLFTKALWKAVGGYDDAIIGYEDWDFWIKCSEFNPKVTQIHEYLFRYRVRNDSLFQWDQQNKADSFWRAMIRLRHPSLYAEERLEQDRITISNVTLPVRAKIEKRQKDFPYNHALRTFVGMFKPIETKPKESTYVPPHPKKPRIRPISAIVPCGPGHHIFLEECIKSIHGQTLQPIEVLVACTDKSTEALAAKLGTTPVLVPHLGAAVARNTLIAKAQGEWIWNLDADDKVNPTFLKKAANFAWQYEKPIITTDSEFFGQPHLATLERSAVARSSKGQYRHPPVNAILTHCPIGSCSLFSKALWEEAGGFPLLTMYEDWAFWIACIKKCGAMVTQMHEHLHYYRIHENSVSEGVMKNKLEPLGMAMIHLMYPDLYPMSVDAILADKMRVACMPDGIREKLEKLFADFPEDENLRLFAEVASL